MRPARTPFSTRRATPSSTKLGAIARIAYETRQRDAAAADALVNNGLSRKPDVNNPITPEEAVAAKPDTIDDLILQSLSTDGPFDTLQEALRIMDSDAAAEAHGPAAVDAVLRAIEPLLDLPVEEVPPAIAERAAALQDRMDRLVLGKSAGSSENQLAKVRAVRDALAAQHPVKDFASKLIGNEGALQAINDELDRRNERSLATDENIENRSGSIVDEEGHDWGTIDTDTYNDFSSQDEKDEYGTGGSFASEESLRKAEKAGLSSRNMVQSRQRRTTTNGIQRPEEGTTQEIASGAKALAGRDAGAAADVAARSVSNGGRIGIAVRIASSLARAGSEGGGLAGNGDVQAGVRGPTGVPQAARGELGRNLERLVRQEAVVNRCWAMRGIEDALRANPRLEETSLSGSETTTIFMDKKAQTVWKVTRASYADPTAFWYRMALFNSAFGPDTGIGVLGYGLNEMGEFSIIGLQRLVDIDKAATNKLTPQRIFTYLKTVFGPNLRKTGDYAFETPLVTIRDAGPGNVVVDKQGRIRVIDIDIDPKPALKDAMTERFGSEQARFASVGSLAAARLGIGGLADAERMEREGADRTAIWRQTGWWRGRDGKWRVEVPDLKLRDDFETLFYNRENEAHKFKRTADVRRYFDTHRITVADIVDDESDALLIAYPDIANMSVEITEDPYIFGKFDTIGSPKRGYIVLNTEAFKTYNRNPNEVFAHEIQHAIQFIEGWGRGGNTENVDYNKYRLYSGEVEARNTERRLSMSPEERASTPPWETEDVDDENQIVRFENGGVSEMARRRTRKTYFEMPSEEEVRGIKEFDKRHPSIFGVRRILLPAGEYRRIGAQLGDHGLYGRDRYGDERDLFEAFTHHTDPETGRTTTIVYACEYLGDNQFKPYSAKILDGEANLATRTSAYEQIREDFAGTVGEAFNRLVDGGSNMGVDRGQPEGGRNDNGTTARNGNGNETSGLGSNDKGSRQVSDSGNAQTSDAGVSPPSFASDESLRAASSPSGVQKSADVTYPDAGAEIASARFASIGSQRKAEMARLLGKHRPDLNADEVVAELEKFGTVKEQKAALHWVIRGGLALPQDAYKISEALGYAESAPRALVGARETLANADRTIKAAEDNLAAMRETGDEKKIDRAEQRLSNARERIEEARRTVTNLDGVSLEPFNYKSPDEMILALHDFKTREPRIDPETVPELSDARDEGDGIVSYLVQDDRQGQSAMRRVIDTHWGEDANPWCLLAKGEERSEAVTTDDFERWLDDNAKRLHDEGVPPLEWGNIYTKETGEGGTVFRDVDAMKEAWRWWQNYSALPKRVAFKSGRLLAFMATERGNGASKVEFSKPENERRVESFYKEYSKIDKDERPGNFQQWMMEEHPAEYDAIAEDEEDGGDAINTYQFSRPAEEWWDRQDESHPDLDWAKERDYAPSRFASDASLRAAEGGLTGNALSDPNIVRLALGPVRVKNPDGTVSFATKVTDIIRSMGYLTEEPRFNPWPGTQNLRAVYAEAAAVVRKDPAAAERIKEKVLDAYKKYQAGDKNAAAKLSISAHEVQVLRAMLIISNQALVAANDAVENAENNGADNLEELRVAELNAEAQYYNALLTCGFAERAIGTALGSLARLMENDFSMGGLLKKLGDVDGGVTAEDAKKLRGVSREGEAAQKKHDDAVKAIEEEERKKLVAGKVDDAVGEGRRNKAAGRKAKTVAEAVEAARKELADGEMVDISVYPELWAQIGDAVKGIARAIIGEHLEGPSRLKALDHAAFARRLLAETNKAFEGRITSRDENHKELTERDVLDLFSDYGDPEKLQPGYDASSNVSADQMREAQSRLKKLSQMMSALADIKAGKAPLEAYGHLRDLTPKQVDEEMERVKKEMDEAWRASGLDKNLLHRAMSPLELVRDGIEKRIAEIKSNLAAGELAKKQGRKTIAGEEGLADLREELKRLQSIQDSVFKNRGLTDEQRLAAIEENYRRTEASAMATLQRLMAGGRPVKPLDMSDDGARSAWATAERAWRQKIGEARRAAADATRRLNELRQRMTPESYRGEKALERAIARREDMAARWEEAVNAGRVTLGGRGIMRDQKMRFDPRLVEADRALRDVIAKRDRLIAEIKYDHAKGWEKLKMNLSAIPNTMRQMLASGDNSGIGVQCAVATLANPKDGIKAIFPGIKVFWNTLFGNGMATERYMESLYRDPDFERIAAYVEIPRTDGKGNFTQNSTEEFFQHGVVAERLQKILHVPIFDNKYMRASEAGFNVPVAMIRFELAKRLLAHLRDMKGEGYTPTNEEMSLIGKVVNAATGRGKFLSGGGPIDLSNVFWAAGRVSGQVESLFLPARLFLKHGEVDLAFRKKIARELIWKPWRNFAAAALLFGLAHAIFKDDDDDDPFMELDPTSSKFLRMKVGTRYFDITSGMPSYITLAAKGIWGEKKTVGGKRVALRGQGAFGQSWSNELWRFFRNKLRPEYGNIISLFDGRNAIGEEIEPTALGVSKFLAVNGFLPLTAKDIVDSIEDFDRNGPLFTASLAFLANLGYTTSNFGQTPYKNDRAAIETIDEVRKQAEAGVEGMDDAWSDIALNEDNARYIKAASDKQMVKLAGRIKELDGLIRNGETTKDRKSGRVVSRRKLTREERRAAEREKDALEAEYHERLWPELKRIR